MKGAGGVVMVTRKRIKVAVQSAKGELRGGLWRAAVVIVRTALSEMADQATFLVVLVVQGLGEDLDKWAVRAGRLLGVEEFEVAAADLVGALGTRELVETLAL